MVVSVLGIASAVPDLQAPSSRFDDFARKWAKPSKALDKTLFINGHTGIDFRASVHDETSELITRPDPPPIQDICDAFLDLGVPLALKASQEAITDWGQSKGSITHLICTTCTGSSHPGYDLHLHQKLGLNTECERTLLHGIGCAGGLAVLRLARQICLAAEATGRKARVLIVALEVVSSMMRTELQSIEEEAERGGTWPNIASVLFSDAASAMIVGSGSLEEDEHASFEVLECIADTVADTSGDLAFNINDKGWRAVLTPRVPELTAAAVPSIFTRLMKTANDPRTTVATEHDWFIHTGGSLIIQAVSEQMSLADAKSDPTQTLASWERYRERGNSSSACIGGVIEKGRELGGRKDCVAVSFGPGVTVEMCLLRRCNWRGRPQALANGHSSDQTNGHITTNGHAGTNGHAVTNGHAHTNGDTSASPGKVANGHASTAEQIVENEHLSVD